MRYMKKKILLCILDGWGIGEKNNYNAIHIAKTLNFQRLEKKYINMKYFYKYKWVLQRITGLLLIPLSFWFIYQCVTLHGATSKARFSTVST